MSSAWLGAGGDRTLAAWETMGKVWFTSFDARTGEVAKPIGAMGTGKEKHPVAVSNGDGETLLAWAEGTGWQQGGAVAWQVFDRAGNATQTKGRRDGVPVWSLVAAAARNDGSFEILY